MAFKFENLKIWQRALELSIKVSTLASSFPTFERYSLSNQIRRAADSVVLNIAEGSTGQTNAEFSRFLVFSLRSAVEVVSCLFIAKKKEYLSEEIFTELFIDYEGPCKMISTMKRSLK